MNLFQTISELVSMNSSVSIKIQKINIDNKSKLKVMVIPEIDTRTLEFESKRLSPIIFTGSAEELDEQFLDKIKEPLFKTNVTAQSISSFYESLDKFEKDAKKTITKQKKSSTSKTQITSTEKPKKENKEEKKDDEPKVSQELKDKIK